MEALRDPAHALVKFTKAHDDARSGRSSPAGASSIAAASTIDTWTSDVERPAPTAHDLWMRSPRFSPASRSPHATTQAVGCFIADFAR